MQIDQLKSNKSDDTSWLGGEIFHFLHVKMKGKKIHKYEFDRDGSTSFFKKYDLSLSFSIKKFYLLLNRHIIWTRTVETHFNYGQEKINSPHKKIGLGGLGARGGKC